MSHKNSGSNLASVMSPVARGTATRGRARGTARGGGGMTRGSHTPLSNSYTPPAVPSYAAPVPSVPSYKAPVPPRPARKDSALVEKFTVSAVVSYSDDDDDDDYDSGEEFDTKEVEYNW